MPVSLYADPHKLRQFLQAMTGLSMGSAVAIAQKFPWTKYETFIDVGGAQGGLVVQGYCQLKENFADPTTACLGLRLSEVHKWWPFPSIFT